MTKTNKLIPTIVVIILVIFGIVRGNTVTEESTIKLGLMSPLSGEYAVAGQNYQKGIEVALDEYRKANPNSKIELIIEDDGFDIKKGISAYKKLTAIDKIDALMMLSTPVINTIYPDINKTDLVVMQLGIQTEGVSKDNIFQTSPLPEQSLSVYMSYLQNKKDFKKIAVVYDNTPGGISFYNSFKNGYTKENIPMIVNDKKDLRAYATQIAGDDSIDSVLFLTSPDNGALFTKDLLILDKTMPKLMFDAQLYTGYENYKKILGDVNVINGAESMWLKEGNAEHFKKLYKQKYNEEPGFLADFGYDTFNIMMKSYDSNQDTWMKNIQAYKDSNGASGTISFDANGIRIQDIVINKIKDGKIVVIE